MSGPPTSPVSGAEHAESAAPAPAAAGAPKAPAAPGYTTQTTISSVAQLREIAPEVYDKMMQGIAMQICNEMKKHQDEIKKIMRDASRDAEGKG